MEKEQFVISDIEKILSMRELKLYKKLKDFGACSLEEIILDFNMPHQEAAEAMISRLRTKLNRLGREQLKGIKIGKDKFLSYYIAAKDEPLI